jgi:hypothetical protein
MGIDRIEGRVLEGGVHLSMTIYFFPLQVIISLFLNCCTDQVLFIYDSTRCYLVSKVILLGHNYTCQKNIFFFQSILMFTLISSVLMTCIIFFHLLLL